MVLVCLRVSILFILLLSFGMFGLDLMYDMNILVWVVIVLFEFVFSLHGFVLCLISIGRSKHGLLDFCIV